MATRLTPKKSEGKKPTRKRVSPDQPPPAKIVSNGPAQDSAPGRDRALHPITCPQRPDRKALRDADAGKNLTEYADADDLFRKLGITLGQEKV